MKASNIQMNMHLSVDCYSIFKSFHEIFMVLSGSVVKYVSHNLFLQTNLTLGPWRCLIVLYTVEPAQGPTCYEQPPAVNDHNKSPPRRNLPFYELAVSDPLVSATSDFQNHDLLEHKPVISDHNFPINHPGIRVEHCVTRVRVMHCAKNNQNNCHEVYYIYAAVCS